MAGLRFSPVSTQARPLLEEREWRQVLSFCDRAQLTLLWRRLCRDDLPDWVRRRLDSNLEGNAKRMERIQGAFFEIADALEKAGIEYVMLKGFTQWPHYVADLRERVQYDLDLYCPPETVFEARDLLLSLRYESAPGFKSYPRDHLPAMRRRTPWKWRGDYFDPEMPFCVDLHFRFWDEDTERIPATGTQEFWQRRGRQPLGAHSVPALHPADGLAYHALHLLRHVLRGSVGVCHVYELAYFLEGRAEESEFWETWRGLHEPPLRRLEAVCFLLAASWFACRLHPVAQEEIESLPGDTQLWFEHYAASPLEAGFRPNKDELWLHFALLDSFGDKRKVLLRRLFPLKLPPVAEPNTFGDESLSWRQRTRAWALRASHAGTRALYHARALVPTLTQGIRWSLRGRSFPQTFWLFLGVASLVNFGLFVFFLLYNLYLLDCGFQEDFLGLVTGATMAGNLAGALPAGLLAQRLGLRKTLLCCFVGWTAASALRSLVPGAPALLGLAFLSGVFWAFWAVTVAPAIAQSTGEAQRSFGFSLFFASGIGLGVLGGWAGGHLPAWAARFGLGAIQAKQVALLTGCAMVALAAIPASFLSFTSTVRREPALLARNPFLVRFLCAVAVWNLATGSFNPFFNAYFSRALHAPVERIGLVFSASQTMQVAAILLAPAVLRRHGLVTGIMGMQVSAGMALGCLAACPWIVPAANLTGASALAYMGYMAFQWMSEPGMYSLLMNRVLPAEQSGASAANFLVIFSSHAIAAALAGKAFARFGYPPVLVVAAALAVFAGALFRGLLSKFETAKNEGS